MRIGCCGSMIAPATDPIGIETVETLAALGFDYVELSLSDLAAMPEAAFSRLARRIESSGIVCEACNNFFPRTIRLTGPGARLPVALDYARMALDRSARLGVRVVVFGSAGAKNVPDGFPHDDAWQQITELLGELGPIAAQSELMIVVEPINRLESNIVNLASEGLQLVRTVHHPNIQLLLDFYHLSLEHESPDIVVEAGAAVRHLHFADIEGRRFPAEVTPAVAQFFRRVREARYEGRCSIEACTQNFAADARRALALLRSIQQEPFNEKRS
jgi:D-psicose/D-tagatose/L-ribulose 3-epimerase